MQKPIIFTGDLIWYRSHLSDFEIRGIYSYLNELLEDLHDANFDAENDFGAVYTDGKGKIECTINPGADWLITDQPELGNYGIQRFYIDSDAILYADIQHYSHEDDEMRIRIN